MRYLTVTELLALHTQILKISGGESGVREIGLLESAAAQPRMTFDKNELYPTLVDKAATLGFSIIQNHPFVDGNKRTGHAAMEVFLVLNGYEIDKSVDEQESIILQVASGQLTREDFAKWLKSSIIEIA